MSTTSAQPGRIDTDTERPAGGAADPGYWVEPFTAEERSVLTRYVTNVDGPVFALRNLPETVKAALFARYSRTGKSLRRLFLDEFADQAEDGGFEGTVGTRRATELYERVFDEYGDDSVAQLGGAHLACEQASNVLTKLLEWGRLAAYLEQSTRYVSYAERRDGRFRYHVDPKVDASGLGPEYRRVLDRIFTTYGDLLPRLVDHLAQVMPHQFGMSEPAWRRAVRARAFDGLRGLLPAATTSNLGIFATGQAFEALLLRLRASQLPEARAYADLMLPELRQVIPTFLTRVDRRDRGVAWSAYLAGTAADSSRVAAELLGDTGHDARDDAPLPPVAWSSPAAPAARPVRLVDFDPAGEDKVLAAIAYEHTRLDATTAARRVAGLSAQERARLLDAYVGDRINRRHKPGRALEQAVYTFDVVADYGAFRDLQRHRMCTIVWQPLSPALGYEVPPDVEAGGLGNRFRGAMADSASLYEALRREFPAQAPYAVALAHRVRFLLTINARALMHLAELRSTEQGHPTYRTVAQQLHRLVADQAGHRALAAAMRYVVHDDPAAEDTLGRLGAEERLEARRAARPAQAAPVAPDEASRAEEAPRAPKALFAPASRDADDARGGRDARAAHGEGGAGEDGARVDQPGVGRAGGAREARDVPAGASGGVDEARDAPVGAAGGVQDAAPTDQAGAGAEHQARDLPLEEARGVDDAGAPGARATGDAVVLPDARDAPDARETGAGQAGAAQADGDPAGADDQARDAEDPPADEARDLGATRTDEARDVTGAGADGSGDDTETPRTAEAPATVPDNGADPARTAPADGDDVKPTATQSGRNGKHQEGGQPVDRGESGDSQTAADPDAGTDGSAAEAAVGDAGDQAHKSGDAAGKPGGEPGEPDGEPADDAAGDDKKAGGARSSR